MKILLTAINAKYIHSNLAVYNLRAYAKKHSKSIELAEYTINHRSEFILQELFKRKPDVLCFSCYIWNYDYVREIAAEFHKLRPEVPIWVGGPEVSYEIEKMFAENPAFFGVVIGEGEAAFSELCEYYCDGGRIKLSEIAGIAYRDEYISGDSKDAENTENTEYAGKCHRKAAHTKGAPGIVLTHPREPLDLSTVPFCYEDMKDFENRIVYYESSRGCPFSCSYCLSSIDKKLRFRDIELVKKELLFFIEKKVPQVKFVDRTFNCNHAHAMAIWQFIKEQDLGITNFHFEIAADLLTEEEITLLSTLRPGLVQLEIGVQSTNLKTIEEIHRKMQLSEVEAAVHLIQKAGNIHEHLDLIAGLPFEDYERFQKSFRDIYALKPNQLQLGFLKVLKGSYIYEHSEEYGMIYRERSPYEIMQTKWLSYDEVLSIKLVEEMLEVYYNSGQFEVTMKLLDVVYPDAFDLFLKLGEFYEKKGYLSMNHSRIRRCEILLEFFKEEETVPIELMEEALLYDLYYRENMKSRPYWARNISEFAKVTKTFCKNGKLSHIEPFSYHFPDKMTKRISKLPKRLSEEIYVLFDYKKRDVLDHQAKTTEITKQEVETAWENAQMKF